MRLFFFSFLLATGWPGSQQQVTPCLSSQRRMVRLRGSTSYAGVVEICWKLSYEAQYNWEPVCHEGWGSAEAAAVCQELGVRTSPSSLQAANVGSEGQFVGWRVSCSNSQSCSTSNINIARCYHGRNAAVICDLPPQTPLTECPSETTQQQATAQRLPVTSQLQEQLPVTSQLQEQLPVTSQLQEQLPVPVTSQLQEQLPVTAQQQEAVGIQQNCSQCFQLTSFAESSQTTSPGNCVLLVSVLGSALGLVVVMLVCALAGYIWNRRRFKATSKINLSSAVHYETAKNQQLPSNMKGGQYPISTGAEANYDIICDQFLSPPEQTKPPASSAITYTNTSTSAPTKAANNAQNVDYEMVDYVGDVEPVDNISKNTTLDGKTIRKQPLQPSVPETHYEVPSSVPREWPPEFSVPETSYEVPSTYQYITETKHKTTV